MSAIVQDSEMFALLGRLWGQPKRSKKSVTVFDSTIVGVETDTGLVGYGEVCPLGPFYLPAYAEGVLAGLRELGPHLLGEDPRQLTKLNRTTDFNSYVTVSTAEGAPLRVNGRMASSKAPGLGIQPKLDALGKRVVEVH